MDTKKKPVRYLVADTTAFINNTQLQEYADFIFTTSDVVKEITNKRQLHRLCVLPYDLEVIDPYPENVQYCTQFAKKTGDFISLSAVDLTVIALTYQLEKDNVGQEHLRKEPVPSVTFVSRIKPRDIRINTPVIGFYKPKGKTLEDQLYEILGESFNCPDKKTYIAKYVSPPVESEDKEESIAEVQNGLENLKVEEKDGDNVLAEKTESLENSDHENEASCNEDIKEEEKIEEKEDEDKVESDEEDNDEEENEEDEDDDEGGWITPRNIQNLKKTYNKDVEDEKLEVACMTTDYALQNVLKQMNLKLVALNGKIIKHMRTYIQRCYACFKTTSQVTKTFCPNCGHKTLKKVAVSLDENGQQKVHINIRRPLTARGKNKTIAPFKGGKHSTNPLLFEDQPIPKQMPSRIARTKTDALDDNYTAGYSPFVPRDLNSKSALLRRKGVNHSQWTKNLEHYNQRKGYKN